MSTPAVIKDPQATIDYGFDWSLWLGPGDAITDSSWAVTPAETPAETPLAVLDDSKTSTMSRATLSGGAAGLRYEATNTITTALGRTDQRSIVVLVEER